MIISNKTIRGWHNIKRLQKTKSQKQPLQFSMRSVSHTFRGSKKALNVLTLQKLESDTSKNVADFGEWISY